MKPLGPGARLVGGVPNARAHVRAPRGSVAVARSPPTRIRLASWRRRETLCACLIGPVAAGATPCRKFFVRFSCCPEPSASAGESIRHAAPPELICVLMCGARAHISDGRAIDASTIAWPRSCVLAMSGKHALPRSSARADSSGCLRLDDREKSHDGLRSHASHLMLGLASDLMP